MPTLFDLPTPTLRPLRERQARAIDAIREEIRKGHKRIVCQGPTGFGKTLLAAHVIQSALNKGRRPIFMCPAINLVNQTLRSFEAEGIRDIGVIQAQHERTDWTQPVQIASVQTLIRRALPEVDFVIIDEVHQIFDGLNSILDSEAWKDKIVIGLSATPWTKGMGLRWTSLVVAARTSDLIEEGFLTPFRIFAPAEDPDLSKVRTTAGDYNEADLSEAMDKPKLVADIVETWLKHGDNLPTFLFAVDRKHAKSLRDEFESKGISCGYIDAFSNDDERKETFRRFRSGEDKIIASVGCLITGVDEDVRVIIDGAPTRSEIRHVQKLGRGLRTAPGKTHLTILDHAGNTLRLGMVTDIHHEHLDTRKKGEKGSMADDQPAPKPKKCKECGALMPRGAKACPSCGVKQQEISGVLVERGELVEFGSGKKKPLIEVSKAEKQLWYSGFLQMAIDRQRKPGWAAWRYKEKFGVWPRSLEHVAYPPTLEMKRFDEHCRIKYAKGRH